MSKEVELCDIDANLITETKDAFCITVEDDTFIKEADRIWLPKSKVENNNDGSFTLPVWLAEVKGLI